MLSDRVTSLNLPPRRVPLCVICRTMLGMTGVLGGIFLIMGTIAAWIFAGDLRPGDEVRLAIAGATDQGIITRVASTNATENDVPVYAYHYRFTPRGGQAVTGVSYATGRRWSVEDRVTIEYVPTDPTIARVKGARISQFSWFVLFVYLFPLVGAVLFATSTFRGLRHVNLLRHGEMVGADIISTGATNTRVNNRPVLKHVYEFTASDGESYIGECKSLASGRVGDEEQEPVLYLPSNPRQSVLVDALPMRYPLDIDKAGQWSMRGGVGVVLGYGLILLGIAVTVAYVFVRVVAELF